MRGRGRPGSEKVHFGPARLLAAAYVLDRKHSGSHQIDGGEEFLACFQAVAKSAQHAARDHCSLALAYASAGHASMGPFNDNGDALRLKDPLQGVGDLGRDPFLNLEPLSVDLDEPGQF
jgi:hypothetical protein